MRLPLEWMRYLFAVIPAISTMYLAEIDSYTYYTFFVLLLLWIIQIQKRWLPPRFYFIGSIVEILYIGWLSFKYEGILFIILFSTLISLFQTNWIRPRIVLILGQILILNFSLDGQSPSLWILSNTLFVMFAVLLYYLHLTADRNKQIEQLNDELRNKHYELDAVRKRLVEYAKEVQHISQMEERNRISHDIHDDLGHKLIRLKMMLEAIVQIMPTQQQKAMDMIVQVRNQLTDSMETLRSTVRKMKPAKQESNSYSLNTLIDEFGVSCGIQVNYQTSGAPFALYPSEEFVLYRNAQEAMTNALRHGKATEVTIHLHYGLKQIEFSVSNNGSLPRDVSKKGLGLSGMEERIQLLGGQLIIEFTDQFTIITRIPHHGNV